MGKFTDKMISNLQPKEKMFQQRESDGFGIRVLPSGVKIFIFVYTVAAKRRQMNLGDYPDISLAKARERASEARLALKNGKDPQEIGIEWHSNPVRERREALQREEEDRRNPTVRQLAHEYMERHAKIIKRESSWIEDERLLNKDVLPIWGDRKANEIKKRDVMRLLESVLQRGPALCNNILKVTRKMFNFAVERDILEHTPFAGVKSPAPITARDRTLSETEIRAFWNTELPKASMTPATKAILKLILLTGQRPGEVAGMHSREIEDNWWTIPAERAKNNTLHRVFLTKTALELIGNQNGFVFPSRSKEGHIDENAVAYAIRRNLKDYTPRRAIKGDTISMVKVAENRKMKLDHFTPHDLRRTAATFLALLGYSDEIIDAVISHKKVGVIKIYNRHKYDKEKQAAMESWELKLSIIVNNAN
jgi:integrase